MAGQLKKTVFHRAGMLAFFLALSLGLAGLSSCRRPVAPSGGEENALAGVDRDIAVRVNERVYSRAEFEDRLDGQMEQFRQFLGDGEDDPEIREQLSYFRSRMAGEIVEQVITRFLLEELVAGSEVVVGEEEFQARWDMVTARFPDEDALREILDGQGLTMAEAREQVRDSIKLEKIISERAGPAEVSDGDVLAFYRGEPEHFKEPEQVRASHILLEGDDDATRERLVALRGRVEAGEDFAALAAEYSACPSSGRGGDLGFFGRDEMVEAFSRVAFSLEPGKVSEPVLTDFGFHLIRVEEKTASRTVPFEEVRDEIREYLENRREGEVRRAFLDDLRRSAEVVVNVPGVEP